MSRGGKGPVSLRYRIEYAGFLLLRGLLLLLPESWGMALGGAMGSLAGRVLGSRWRVTLENVARAFPEQSAAWHRRVARASFRHLGRESAVVFRLGGADQAWVRRVTQIENEAEIRADVEAGRGVVLFTGHLGNWEVGGAALAARGIPVDAVVQVQRNPLFDRALVRAREGLGLQVMDKRRAHRGVLRSLRQGRVAGMVADQNVVTGGVFVDFFGIPAATARGPAVLALRSGAPLWVGVCLRLPGRRARYRVMVERVDVARDGEVPDVVQALTEACARRLEAWVRDHPEQYFWQHKRWKTRPPIPEPEPSRHHTTH